ncbi:glucose-6-phosphate isomerase [Legionella lytica]|uniref:Glucose-6-phosphate isomerase n=1 Tax=Legionella lytica TaxID=96232 RepID=A0ABW8D6B0_9GAMM
MNRPTELNSWKKLKGCTTNLLKSSLLENAYVSSEHLSLDFSGQPINESILNQLLELAHESNLSEHMNALLEGECINNTENRPALHTALRAQEQDAIYVNGHNVVVDVTNVRHTMKAISAQIREGKWLGYTGKAITDVVNLGIGGSMLGPFFCIDALSDYVTNQLNFHFVAEVDPNAFTRVSAKLNPETTLFIVSSKSFTTPETLYNMEKALAWMGQEQHIDKHFIAVTANVEKASELGFKQVLPIWDWVGGRYSVCSSINLITCIAIGYEHFSALLDGANSMDQHFRSTEFSQNLPVLLALLGIWNINFLNNNNLLMLTYSEDLKYLVPYLQQLDMESNGKSVNKQGQRVSYDTGPIIWGGPGNHAQHSYYQLLCQGTRKIAADLISVKTFDQEPINKMCLGHRKVLTEGVAIEDNPYNYVHGEVPVNHISLADSTPKTLGALIALYEHKIFVQGVIWNINSFDQPGVESAKKIFKRYA